MKSFVAVLLVVSSGVLAGHPLDDIFCIEPLAIQDGRHIGCLNDGGFVNGLHCVCPNDGEDEICRPCSNSHPDDEELLESQGIEYAYYYYEQDGQPVMETVTGTQSSSIVDAGSLGAYADATASVYGADTATSTSTQTVAGSASSHAYASGAETGTYAQTGTPAGYAVSGAQSGAHQKVKSSRVYRPSRYRASGKQQSGSVYQSGGSANNSHATIYPSSGSPSPKHPVYPQPNPENANGNTKHSTGDQIYPTGPTTPGGENGVYGFPQNFGNDTFANATDGHALSDSQSSGTKATITSNFLGFVTLLALTFGYFA
jgi:hypothetical protein